MANWEAPTLAPRPDSGAMCPVTVPLSGSLLGGQVLTKHFLCVQRSVEIEMEMSQRRGSVSLGLMSKAVITAQVKS